MFEKLLTGPNLMCIGLMISSAIMLRNSTAKSRRSRSCDDVKDVQSEFRRTQCSAETPFQRMEVRRHDYDRDVAARVETTMTMLDQWIAEADLEIARLETMLAEQQPASPAPLSAEQRRMVVHLAEAGYPINEIARLIDHPPTAVARLLEDGPPENRKAA